MKVFSCPTHILSVRGTCVTTKDCRQNIFIITEILLNSIGAHHLLLPLG